MTALRKLACGLGLGLLFAPLPAMPAAAACSTTLAVNFQDTNGATVVELRLGVPGSSRLVDRKEPSGGSVNFSGLCPGSYFLAIGDQDYVGVTPVHQFEETTCDTRARSRFSKARATQGTGRARTSDRIPFGGEGCS